MYHGKMWTVARFPSGNWCTGGPVSDPEYAMAWVTQVVAKDRVEAKRKGQAQYYREQKKAKKNV